MNTYVRIINGSWSPTGFKNLDIQVLRDSSRHGDLSYFDVAFSITFQTDNHAHPVTGVKDHLGKWYGMNFEVRTDKVENLAYATQLLRRIKKVCYYDSTPKEMLKVIGAVQFQYLDNGHFVPVSMNGCNEYVIHLDGRGYTTIYAFSEDEARLKFDHRHYGYPPERVSVFLKREKLVIEETDLTAM